MDDEFDIRLPETIQLSDKYKFIPEWYMNPKNWRYKEHLRSEDNQHNNQLCCIVAGIPHVFAWGGCHGADDKQAVFEKIVADPNYEIKPVETRRKWCKQYLANYKVPTIENLGRLERIKRVSQRLQGKPITVHNQDYQSVPIPQGAVIYCDIPYKDTGKYQREFDYDRFYQWAIQQDNIYISSYEMPEDKFKCVWECDKRCQFSSTNNSLVRKEKIFVPIKPISNECKEDTNT